MARIVSRREKRTGTNACATKSRLARSMERSFHYEKDEMGLVFIDSAEQREGKSQKTRILEKPKGSATRVNILATGAAATAKE
jgi:hypothetical protein